jgi:hypothetical protein
MSRRTRYLLFLFYYCCFSVLSTAQSNTPSLNTKPHYAYFVDFITSRNPLIHQKALKHIKSNWKESDEILLLETLYNLRNYKNSTLLLHLLEQKTGQHFDYDFNEWYTYIWNKPKAYTNAYFDFKAELHKHRDPKFYNYFKNRSKSSLIRLDEVRWGGVLQDGIPPLRNPKMISANAANYLEDAHTVFGIEVNGDFRAYPKRILAWHELFTDTVGNTPVAGVYCTLCGTVILYKTSYKGTNYNLGTSGFLYRSNKLMYDAKTQSLWSTSLGKPVIGPLVNKGIQLEYLSVVTTTWGAWKALHPDTKVLSLKTGHQRNYDEGVAYQDYFSTDDLMFNTSKPNKALKNKDEVLVIKQPKTTQKVIAIASKFLKDNPIYYDTLDSASFVVLTSPTGAHRTYYNKGITFNTYNAEKQTLSSKKGIWTVNEDALINQNTGNTLPRLHSYNAFWFGFYASHNNIRLIK